DDIPQMNGQNLIDIFIDKSAEERLLPQLGIKEAEPLKNKVSEEEETEDNDEDMEHESNLTET
ncbi:tetratricopeptide repeat protein, partial [Phocaeicola vulgatus]|nr:tetratricopeptide repeat protein [Phocaeicola vulgatus]